MTDILPTVVPDLSMVDAARVAAEENRAARRLEPSLDYSVTFPRENRILDAASKEPGRYAFHGVQVDPHGARILATDGRILACVPVEVETPDGTTLNSAALTQIVQPETIKAATTKTRAAGRPAVLWIHASPDSVETTHPDLGPVTARPLEGEFPQVDRVLGDARKNSGVRFALNPTFLLRLAKALGSPESLEIVLADGADAKGIPHAGSKPAYVKATGGDGAIMPIVIDR